MITNILKLKYLNYNPTLIRLIIPEFKSNITALAFFPKILVILTLTLTLSILIIKIINRHNLKDIIYHSTNKF